MKTLYEVTLTAVKTIYVEADSELEALEHDATVEEHSSFGDVDWEFIEGEALALNDNEAKRIIAAHPELVVFIDTP